MIPLRLWHHDVGHLHLNLKLPSNSNFPKLRLPSHFNFPKLRLPSHFNFPKLRLPSHFNFPKLRLPSHFNFPKFRLPSHFNFPKLRLPSYFNCLKLNLRKVKASQPQVFRLKFKKTWWIMQGMWISWLKRVQFDIRSMSTKTLRNMTLIMIINMWIINMWNLGNHSDKEWLLKATRYRWLLPWRRFHYHHRVLLQSVPYMSQRESF